MSSESQDRISAAVWPWRDGGQARAAAAARRRLRRSATQSLAMLAAGVAMLLLARFRIPGLAVPGFIALGLAAAVFAAGRLAPRVFDGVSRFVDGTARLAGVAATWSLLVPFFYLCFVPGRLILRARGRDPMTRKFPTDEETYWVPRPARRPGHFERQY